MVDAVDFSSRSPTVLLGLLLQSHPLLVRHISQFHTPTSVRPMVDFGKMEVTSKSCADNSECARFFNSEKVFLSHSTKNVDSKQPKSIKPPTGQSPVKLLPGCQNSRFDAKSHATRGKKLTGKMTN